MPQISADLGVFRHALYGHSLSQVGDSLLQTKLTSPFSITDIQFKPSASLAVRVLNRAEDKDEDAVFGGSEAAHVPYAVQSAWLKYTLDAKATAKIGFSPELTAGASHEVALSDYRLHDAADSAWDALTDDLQSPRTLLELSDVRKLKPCEALAMEVGGTLTASVSISWSDVLAAKLPEILGHPAPVSVTLKSGLDTSLAVQVADHFSVVVSRTRDGHYRFAVKKAASRSHTFGVDVAAGMEASALPGIDEVLEAIFANAPSQLDGARDQVRSKLAAAAKWKASTGFAYEYARIAENQSVADFILLDDSRLAGDYALVLAGDFARIADALQRDTASRRLVQYLNESTLTRRRALGFTLGLGKWALQASDTSVFRQTVRTSLDGFQLITCSGTRKYDEKNVPQNDFEWTVDLKAQMREFLSAPSSLDFDYGLGFVIEIERGAIAEGDLERMLDLAAMWDVCVPPIRDFAGAVGKKGSLRVQLLFDRDALLAAAAKETDLASWAEPLAMAMPYMSTFPERRTFTARRDTYTAAWRAWLGDGTVSTIRANSGLTIFERQGRPGSFAWTAGEGHAQLRRRLESFVEGTRQLHALMTTAHPPAAIAEAYGALEQFWSQRLYVAAAGRWLLDRADGAVRATLQVEYADTSVTS